VGKTVAVNVTDCPAATGFRDETRATLDPALLTVTASTGEVLAVSRESPL